jgi:hypothetical protein
MKMLRFTDPTAREKHGLEGVGAYMHELECFIPIDSVQALVEHPEPAPLQVGLHFCQC